ncbi:integrase catalytic domain-containing protein [Trichonephila clavipes]|nr:integrase catalytic domain-containing protein [Trichonephila clavipes]
MEVNALKAARKGLRTAFSLSLKKIETELIKENIDMNQLSILKTQFIDKFQRLDTCQSQISEQLLDTEDAVQEYLDDMEDAENYRDRYIEMCTRVDLKIRETVVPTETEKRSFKLPKIELKKFSGEAKDFLAFWSQFQKIHNVKSIVEEDKMQYLLQSVEPKSNGERLVLSFPATAENYPKAIGQLKERFGREDLLVQIYVRELLSLVMKNAVSGRTKTDLSALYDKLEGKLRSLESLGRTQEKYGDFLAPLVESCLPEEILMAWERKRNTETDAKGSRTLEHLMTFLRLEVQGEEMVQLAKSGFGTLIRKKDSPTERVKPTELMTASALASSEKSSAIETKLGWTVIGKVCSNDKNVMLTTSSLHVRNVSVKELWELDVLEITDPLLNENTKENFELTDFKNKMKILRDGRYEVKLPWKCNSENLPSNKELTWKRHLRMMNKLRNGVNLIELIPDILDRFRIYPVGIVADIEKEFLMLSVAPKDRDYLRFFSHAMKTISVQALSSCVWGVFKPLLIECIYYASFGKLADEIEIFIEKTKLIMSEGCFNLRIFESNVASKSVDKHSGETFILGIIWDLDNDVLKCCTNFDSLTCEVKITKRLVLSTMQKVFDPIGMLAPSTLLPKLLLQEIWKMKKAWDQKLPQNIVNKFMKWFNKIQILKDVNVPRCMKIDIFTELHVFVDASKGSCAGCVFARSIVDSRVSVILVRAKSRVAPLKLLSIPRLELMACCVGARLLNSILKALNMPDLKVTLWSDSTTALWWIKEYGNWSVFVANRVKEIRQLTQIQSWKYVPGNMNIADLLSRGCSPRQMLNSRWWEGPSWLKQNSEFWPDGEISCEPQEVNVERKKTKNANVDLANDAPPCLYVMCLIMIK